VTPINGLPENRGISMDTRIPSAMRARPKIPRTPIPLDRLEQARRANEDLLMNGYYVQKNESASKKKQVFKPMPKESEEKQMYPKEEDPLSHPLISDAARQKVIRSEAKSREDRKAGKDFKKEAHYTGPKKKEVLDLTVIGRELKNDRNIQEHRRGKIWIPMN